MASSNKCDPLNHTKVHEPKALVQVNSCAFVDRSSVVIGYPNCWIRIRVNILMVSKQDRKSAFRFIIALGFVSLFADMTYEGAHSVIGPLLKDLGASATQVGIIAGLGEMIAASLRYFSGRLADKTRAYWTITTLGYFLNLIVVPGLAFAGNWQAAALLIVAERTGKSLRGPARDVLLSEATEVVFWALCSWQFQWRGRITSARPFSGLGCRPLPLSSRSLLRGPRGQSKALRRLLQKERTFPGSSGSMLRRQACWH